MCHHRARFSEIIWHGGSIVIKQFIGCVICCICYRTVATKVLACTIIGVLHILHIWQKLIKTFLTWLYASFLLVLENLINQFYLEMVYIDYFDFTDCSFVKIYLQNGTPYCLKSCEFKYILFFEIYNRISICCEFSSNISVLNYWLMWISKIII